MAAQRLLQNPGVESASRAARLAALAVDALPNSGQFQFTLGEAAYRVGKYKEARAAFRRAAEIFRSEPRQVDRQANANLRMRVFRTAGYLDEDLDETAAHIFDQMVLKSLEFLGPGLREDVKLDAPAIASLDGYSAWFENASLALTWLYLALAEAKTGGVKESREALDTAESMLKVCPEIDNGTLLVWAEAAQQVR
jgi:tetratricopeptide (TPR) repeat protein